MKIVKVYERDPATAIFMDVAEMPLFIWKLTGWLCKYDNAWGQLGGNILLSYKCDYRSGRSWRASLIDGVKVWWGCRKEWRHA